MKTELSDLLELAAAAQGSWEPHWSGFVPGADQEAALDSLEALSELTVHRWGGFAAAERQRFVLVHSELACDLSALQDQDLIGVELLGNFLFDPAEADDFRQALLQAGLPAAGIGDIWLRGDRGAQAVLQSNAAELLAEHEVLVRTVPITVQLRPLAELQPPPPRQPRRFSSVEASLRLDAVGSAGFGLSRSRMAGLIRAGAVRLNWQPATSPSKELRCGDCVQLQNRGELVLEGAELTKKNRWRVALIRR